ncbi:hypothetical protein N1851_032892 [Merluccius polli]|uniref:DDE Tnp4 domain-containing protein n=1 Tax=Merluccius polli TaxID=89951 RepID=A0AA47M2A1_MERPO|nr:hypothetical protein N1851_032892 [Merluccius polli]
MPEYCLRVASDSFSRDIMCRAIGTCWGTVATHANYSRAHKTTRAVVERGIGQLKRRFHMRLTPDKVCKVIIACAILHNICKARQIRSRENDNDDENIHPPQGSLAQSGLPYRAQFTNLHFRQVTVHLKTCGCIELIYHTVLQHMAYVGYNS